MPVRPSNILKHELIGLKTVIAGSSNSILVGTRGHVVDETRNTVKLSTKSGVKVIPKDVAVFRFKLPDGTSVEVDGTRLIGRPENRLKAKTRRW
jgi:ribonuclease P protein subunit POP4